jgi:UMF1 family MFS transporter
VILIALTCLTIFSTLTIAAKSPWQFFILSCLIGVFVGPLQSASRSILAKNTPESYRSQMFGLLAFSGKATAFLGPFIVGGLNFWTNNLKLSLSIIPILFFVGLLLMRKVEVH